MRVLTLLLALSCAKASTASLEPVEAALRSGDLQVDGRASVSRVPAQGYDLRLELDVVFRGQDRARLDLGRSMIRIDGFPWTACRPSPQSPTADLVAVLEPGEVRSLVLICGDIRAPSESVDLRFFSSGTGGSGALEMSFRGMR